MQRNRHIKNKTVHATILSFPQPKILKGIQIPQMGSVTLTFSEELGKYF